MKSSWFVLMYESSMSISSITYKTHTTLNTQQCQNNNTIHTQTHTPGLWSCSLSLWCRWSQFSQSLLLVEDTSSTTKHTDNCSTNTHNTQTTEQQQKHTHTHTRRDEEIFFKTHNTHKGTSARSQLTHAHNIHIHTHNMHKTHSHTHNKRAQHTYPTHTCSQHTHNTRKTHSHTTHTTHTRTHITHTQLIIRFHSNQFHSEQVQVCLYISVISEHNERHTTCKQSKNRLKMIICLSLQQNMKYCFHWPQKHMRMCEHTQCEHTQGWEIHHNEICEMIGWEKLSIRVGGVTGLKRDSCRNHWLKKLFYFQGELPSLCTCGWAWRAQTTPDLHISDTAPLTSPAAVSL